MPLITCGEFTVDYMDVGEGPPVSLIPSSGSGNRQWRKLVGDLSARYRMLSMNLFGYGETSAWPKKKEADTRRSGHPRDCYRGNVGGTRETSWAFIWRLSRHEGSSQSE